MTGAQLDGYAVMRTVRSDQALSSTQRALLAFAVVRAETAGKNVGRVRASLEMVSQDAGLSAKSAERAFREPAVLRYFARVERRTRSVGLWFHLTPDKESGVEGTANTPTPDTVSGPLPMHLQETKQAATTNGTRRPTPEAESEDHQVARQLADAMAGADLMACLETVRHYRERMTGRNLSRFVRSCWEHNPNEIRARVNRVTSDPAAAIQATYDLPPMPEPPPELRDAGGKAVQAWMRETRGAQLAELDTNRRVRAGFAT